MSDTTDSRTAVYAPETAPSSNSEKPSAWLSRASRAIDTALRIFFYRLGFFVAGNPWKVIAVVLVISLVALAGLLRFKSESRGTKLWVPQNTVALKNRHYVQPRFGSYFRVTSILFVPKSGDDLASKKSLLDIITVIRAGYRARGKPVAPPDGRNIPVTYDSICIKSFDRKGREYCRTASSLDLFYDPDQVETDENGKPDFLKTVESKIRSLSDDAVKATVLQSDNLVSWNGNPLVRDDLVSIKDGKVKALLYTQYAKNNLTVEDGEEVDPEAKAFENAWVDMLVEGSGDIDAKSVRWYVDSTESQSAALDDALTSDLPLFAVGLVLLVIYVILFLGEFHSVQGRMLLGVGAFVNEALALGFTFGVSSLLGMFYGPVHNVLALLLLGVGADDVLVVTKSLRDINQNSAHASRDICSRIALALSHSGTAITVTSLTNLLVFLISSVSTLPALKYFSLWASIGVVADYVWTCTFFTAILALDQRRIDASRRDCCFCMKVQNPKQRNWFNIEFGWFNRFFQNRFGPFILRRYVRWLLTLVFVALFAVCCWAASRVYLKFKFSFFYPSGTQQYEYSKILDENFEQGSSTDVYVRSTDLSSKTNQRKYLNLCDPVSGIVAKSEWIQSSTVDCWYSAMRKEYNITGKGEYFEPSEFEEKLNRFLKTGVGRDYAKDIYFEQSKLEATRFSAVYEYTDSNDEEVDRLKTLRRDVKKAEFGDNAFPYAFEDTYVEQYVALPADIGLSLGLACLSVFIVCFFLIGHPLVAVISMFIVGMVITDVFGFLYFTGYNLNSTFAVIVL